VRATQGQGYQTHGDTWEWNGTEWTQVADIGPAPRGACALSYDTVRQRVMLFGGYGGTNKFFNDTWEWDGTEWTQIADTGPPSRSHHAMVFDRERECLVLFGGYSAAEGWVVDTWEWQADTGWVKRQDIGPRSMSYPTMVYTGEHTVLVGTPAAGSAAEHTWEYDGRLWTQRQDMGPSFRTAHALAYDGPRDRVVLFGGWASPNPLGDTWELAIIEQ
jgi:Galactose oxidase, central domain